MGIIAYEISMNDVKGANCDNSLCKIKLSWSLRVYQQSSECILCSELLILNLSPWLSTLFRSKLWVWLVWIFKNPVTCFFRAVYILNWSWDKSENAAMTQKTAKNKNGGGKTFNFHHSQMLHRTQRVCAGVTGCTRSWKGQEIGQNLQIIQNS